jgi:hypothetical protein
LSLSRGQLRGPAGAFLSGFLRSELGGLLRGEFAPARFFLSASGFGSGLRLSFLMRAQPFFFNGLFRPLPDFLANLRT